MKKNVSLTVSASIVCLSVILGSFCLLPVSCSKKEPPLLLKTNAFTATDNWPQFRGVRAGGIAESMDTPVNWDVEKGTHIKWKAPVPGLGHSSPVIWENRVFLTSAVSENKDPILTPGIFGESPDNPEDYPHDYKLFCFDKNSGKLVWEKTANTAIPRVHRHIKSSHANSSPATDGKHVVAFFGSEGLYCYDMDGNPEWKKDFGLLDAGAFDTPEVQWGFGSSPVIYRDRVIVLCDVNNQSFLTALNVETGEELWRTLRDEVPTWGTPAVHEGGDRTQIIVNGWKHIGSYDFGTGEELWKMKGGGDVPIPTPVIANDRVYITNAHGRMRPVYAVRLDAAGDITLAQGETSNAGIAWMDPRRGTYINTPILWNEYLYILEWNGVFTCYKAQTGEQVYRERAGGSRSSFIASPVASGNRLYLADE